MAVENAGLGQALGAGRGHVLLADLVQKGVLGQHGQGRESADDHGRDGQGQMPEVVQNLVAKGELLPPRRCQAAQREPVEVAAAREKDHEQDGEQEDRDGVAHDHERACPDVEARAVAHGLHDAQGDGQGVDDERAPQSERQGNGDFFADELKHALAAEKALAQVERGVIFEHLDVARPKGLVEAVHALDAPHNLRVQALGSAIGGRGGSLGRDVAPGRLPSRSADPRGGGHVQSLQLGYHLLHRTAGGGLDDEEIERQDAQQGRNDEGETPQDVDEHYFRPSPRRLSLSACSLAGSIHQD